MKEVYFKIITVLLCAIVLPICIYFGNHSNNDILSVFDENKYSKAKVKELIEVNNDKELISNETYNHKFIYLEFQKDEDITSYIIDSETGEEKEFLNYVKEDKKEAFLSKVNELLYLKYPKFIANVLSKEEVNKTYQILENELVIYYDGEQIEPKVNEKLFLKVNYNEIKEYLDFTLSLDHEYENENGYSYDKNKKTVALTFDDGPNGEKTNKIVNILEENKAHATFFMVGNKMESGKETILNVLNKGNEIGSHSYNHKNMRRTKLKDVVSGEEKTNEIYYNITGKELIYTRPPYGNITSAIKNSLNTIFINWSLDTEDWLHRNKDMIVLSIMKNVSDGDIILMHDSYDSTVEAVEEVLPLLYAEGYQVVSVSELASLKGYTFETHKLYRCLKEI